METPFERAAFVGLGLLVGAIAAWCVQAATLYVAPGSPSPGPPYNDWTNAAHDIQTAIDYAQPGDVIWVSNGVYSTGGLRGYPPGSLLTNRVVVHKPVHLVSVNGPGETFIQGARDAGASNGNAAVRCLYATSGATVVGFTLRGGATRASGDAFGDRGGGGAYLEPGAVLSNCVVNGNIAHNYGAGVFGGVLYDCVISCNTSSWLGGGTGRSELWRCVVVSNYASSGGGGCEYGTQYWCRIENNSSTYGGGVEYGWVYGSTVALNRAFGGGGLADAMAFDCLIISNISWGTAGSYGGGGGARRGVLVRCTVGYNTASDGGGAHAAILSNCYIFGNIASNAGGGARFDEYSWMHNCLVMKNVARNGGGVSCVDGGHLLHCTVVANLASNNGGGLHFGRATNSIIYFNAASANSNHVSAGFAYCCTAPLPGGPGNISQNPRFINPATDNYRLRYGSPALDTGSDLSAVIGVDIEGKPRPLDGNYDSSPAFDMGCYEYDPDTADSNEDGVPDGWYYAYGLNPTSSTVATENADGDAFLNREEYVADTNPTDSNSFFRLVGITYDASWAAQFESSGRRWYTLEAAAELLGDAWSNVPGAGPRMGSGGPDFLADTNNPPRGPFYRIRVQLP